MLNTRSVLPEIKNEPILSYAPKSKEREELKKSLKLGREACKKIFELQKKTLKEKKTNEQ